MKRVLMTTFSYYPRDPRVVREARALVDAGMHVDVICLRDPGMLKKVNLDGVNVFRVDLERKRAGKLRYIWQYFRFFLKSFRITTARHLRNRYDLIHVHNMPDFLVFSAILPKLTGAKIVLDLHDPTPEIFMTKFGVDEKHWFIRTLRMIEKLSIRFANLVLTPNIAFRDIFVSRGCPEEKLRIVMNSPLETVFHPGLLDTERENPDDFVLMYHGGLLERSGVDLAVRAVHELRNEIPSLVFHIYGSGEMSGRLLKLIDELELHSHVIFHSRVPLQDIARQISTVDVGIIPNRMSPFTNLNFPTRIFEYLALDKPVIAPKTRGVQDYFGESGMNYFTAGDVESLKQAIRSLYLQSGNAAEIHRHARDVYQQHRWSIEKRRFVYAINSLIHGGPDSTLPGNEPQNGGPRRFTIETEIIDRTAWACTQESVSA
mgnify:CR=1 FL=1